MCALLTCVAEALAQQQSGKLARPPHSELGIGAGAQLISAPPHFDDCVQECLKHVRSLNEKLASGKYAPDSPELKAGVEALRAVLSAPSPKVN